MKPDPRSALDSIVGETVDGRFVVERRVGEGGFAVVYRARQVALGRPVALKVLKAPDEEGGQGARRQETFLAEAQTIARLRHPHIVGVHDYGSTVSRSGMVLHWMALDWLEGRTMAEWLEERRSRGQGALDPPAAMTLLRPVLEALAFAHENGVAHRDVKPGNIFLVTSPDGPVPMLLDFGIAKLAEGDLPMIAQTTRGFAAFSPEYAAPEQVGHGRTGTFTDVHALGLIMSELLTGSPPYAHPSGDHFEAVMSENRPTPGARGISVGVWEPVIARAVALRPAARYPDAGAFLAALDQPQAPSMLESPTLRSSAPDPAARRAYVRARYLFDRGRVVEAIAELQRAIELDPRDAEALAVLAAFHACLDFTRARPGEARARAGPLALRALELAPTMASAHVALGSVLWLYDWDWTKGEQHLLRALVLDPANGLGLFMYGQQRLAAGRLNEAAEATAKALAAEPASRFINVSILRSYYYGRRYDELIAHATSTLASGANDSASSAIRRATARAHLELGMIAQAAQEADAAADQSPDDVELRGTIAVAAGRVADGVAALDRLRALTSASYVRRVHLARLACALGRNREALQELEEGYRMREFDMLFLRVEPRFDALRCEPGFSELVRRVGIPGSDSRDDG